MLSSRPARERDWSTGSMPRRAWPSRSAMSAALTASVRPAWKATSSMIATAVIARSRRSSMRVSSQGMSPPRGGAVAPPFYSGDFVLARSAAADGRSLRALLALHDLHGHRLAFGQRRDAAALERRGMHEDVASAAFRGDEAEALLRAVPLHGPAHLLGRAGGGEAAAGRAAARRPVAEPARTGRPIAEAATRGATAGATAAAGLAGAGDLDHLGHLLALLPGTDAHAEPGTRVDRFATGALQHGDVQEGVAGAVAELHESETLLRVEPL